MVQDPLVVAQIMQVVADPADAPPAGPPQETTAVAVDGGMSEIRQGGTNGKSGANGSTSSTNATGGNGTTGSVSTPGAKPKVASSGGSGGSNPLPGRTDGIFGRIYGASDRMDKDAGRGMFNGTAGVIQSEAGNHMHAGALAGDGFFSEDLEGEGTWAKGQLDGAAGVGMRGGGHITGFDAGNQWARGGEASIGAGWDAKAGAGGKAGVKTVTEDDQGQNAEAAAEVGGFGGAAFDAGVEGWAKGTQVGVTGAAKGSLGVNANGKASAAASGGPAVGSVDPTTGKRKNIAQAEAEASGDVFVGAEGHGQGEAWAGLGGAGAAGEVGVSIGAHAQGAAKGGARLDLGGWTLAGIEAGANVDGFLGARAGAEGSATAGVWDGVSARGSAGAEIGLKGTVGANAKGTLLGTSVGGNVGLMGQVAGEAAAEGQIGMGAGRLGAAGEAEAFAGARMKASLGGSAGLLGVDVISGNLEATLSAGAGGGAGGGIFIRDGVLTISAEFLACAGVGAGLEGNVSIDLLSPFKMILGMLNANGVVNADPNQWIPEIVGYSTGALDFAERAGSGMKKADEPPPPEFKCGSPPSAAKQATAKGHEAQAVAPGKPSALMTETLPELMAELEETAVAEPAGRPAGLALDTPLDIEGASTSQPDTLGELQRTVLGAGGKMNPRTGAIDMLGATADPAALMGDLPGVVGKKHDQALGQAMSTLEQAGGLAQEAAVETHGGLQDAMEQLKLELSNPIDLFKNVLQGALSAIGSLVSQGINSAGQLIGSIAAAAGQTIASVGQLLGQLVRALFGSITSIFTGYQGHSTDLASAFMQATDGITGSIQGIKVGQILDAKSMLTNALVGVAASFSDRADGAFQAAQEKSLKAEELVRGVQNKQLDLGVGKGKFAVDRDAVQDFKGLTSTIGQMTGGTGQVEQEVAGAGPELGATADEAATSADASGRSADQQMHQTFDGPKSNKDGQVAAQKAAADKRMAEFKADPVGTSIKEIAKAGWEWVKSLFQGKK
jgi:hypothetical protein